MSRRLPCLAAAIALLGGDWPDWSGDAGRTRSSTEAIGSSFTMAWNRNTAARIVASPATADGVVVIATESGDVRAFRESDGVPLWSAAAGGQIYASPLIWNGRVYAATVDGSVQARALADGASGWSVSLGRPVLSSPKPIGGLLVLGTGVPNAAVLALDPATGATVWETPMADSVFSSAAADGATLWVGSTDGRFTQLDAATGAPLASVVTPGDVLMRSPAVAFGQRFALPGGADMEFRSLGAWSLTMSDPSPPAMGTVTTVRLDGSCPAVAGALVVVVARFGYTIDTDGNFLDDTFGAQEYAVGIDPVSRTQVWQTLLGSRFGAQRSIVPTLGLCPTPVAVDGGARLAVGSSMDSSLRLLDAATGAVLASFATYDAGRCSPAASNGRLIWGTDGGFLFGFQGSANTAPAAPTAGFSPSGGPVFTTAATSLSWSAAADLEDPASALSYVVRIDSDGEILQDWSQEIATAAGVTTAGLAPPVAPPGTFTWAVRTVDSDGALSPWSALQTFSSVTAPDPPTGLTAFPSIGAVRLTWTPSPTVGVVGYNVRWTPGGGAPLFTASTTATIGGLTNGVTYRFEVRAVDPDGDESVPATVSAAPTDVGIVSVGGVAYPALAPALAAATPGAVILVGRGVFTVPPGMTLVGMSLIGISPHDTWLDAGGLGTAITVMTDAARTPMTLSNFSLYGAETGIDVRSGTVTITHVIVRDMTGSAILVSGPAEVRIVNNTIVGNGGAGVEARDGVVEARSNLVLDNGTGLRRVPPAQLTSRYNDVQGSIEQDYAGLTRGDGDFSAPILFLDAAGGDFREHPGQMHVDTGDPGDPFDLEPSPNGGRINVGAYGNTPWAAVSGASRGSGGGGGGCPIGGAPVTPSGPAWAAALLAWAALAGLRRRR